MMGSEFDRQIEFSGPTISYCSCASHLHDHDSVQVSYIDQEVTDVLRKNLASEVTNKLQTEKNINKINLLQMHYY